ncbi:zonadhesin-like [Amphiura filiformis]|uniref:zonadhesin-like n=1 Tax=Amphiura filiformis TaxID=82378 RepID=UPI003B22643C
MDCRSDVVIVLTLVFQLCLTQGQQPVVVQVAEEGCEDNLETLKDIPKINPHNCKDTCIASGDPHFNTFDCVKFEYHGKCSYTLAKSCGNGSLDFEIIGEFHRLQYHPEMSVIRSLIITFSDKVIILDSEFHVTINGVSRTDATIDLEPYAEITRYCNAVVVLLGNGIQIYWSRPHRAVIQIDPEADASLTGNLCGLCGNNNNKKYDDLTTPDGKHVSDAVTLGDSWRTDVTCDVCDDCEQTICQNNPQNYPRAKELCNIFIDGSISSQPCGNNDMQSLYDECVNILCATLPEVERLCQLINNHIESCIESGVEIQYHHSGECANGCYRNQIFIEYGSSWADQSCSENCTCDSETGINCNDTQCHEHATCTVDPEGTRSCVCNEPEYTGDGFTCTPGSPCEPNPCLNEGKCTIYNVDEFVCECKKDNGYWGPRCENPPPCDSSPCQNGGTCINEGGEYRCVCPFGQWTGPNCNIRCHVCWACGDPHYTTFDGRCYDFQGKCMYTLAKSTDDAPYQFEVVANNKEAYWNTRVTITREIYVFLDFGEDGWWSFCFRYGYGGIQVNYETVSLPYTNRDAAGDMRVHIGQAGYYTFLATNFGLYVGWNGVHCAFIVVPETFVDQVEGLCGLFNLDIADDWTKPDGKSATSKIEFGNSWVYEEIKVCQGECTPETCDDGTGGPCDDNMEKEPMADVLCAFLKTEINLKGKSTEQSSTYDNSKSPSGNAVDGKTDGDYHLGSCIHTRKFLQR